MSARIYIEGGGNSKEGKVRCREGFRKLFEKCGFTGRMPALVACGPRNDAYDDFKTGHSQASPGNFIGLLVDSEEPVADVEQTWAHVAQKTGDNWRQPDGADNEQLLFMTTSMETWMVSDRTALAAHFGPRFNESVLPPVRNLEQRDRHHILNALQNASRGCPGPYDKRPKSFELLGKLNSSVLEEHLPSFKRVRRILDCNL